MTGAYNRAMSHRPAIPADLPRIVDIFNAAIPLLATAETSPITVDSRRDWFEQHNQARYPIWVDERDGVVAGWISISRYYPQSAYDATGEVSVYVEPAYHRQGIARGLLEAAVAKAPSLGFKTLLGYVWAHNQASIGLFQACGFERWARLPQVAEIAGVPYDTVIVGRHLVSREQGECP
jgi:L-amino acid N-acyltransferase YncA